MSLGPLDGMSTSDMVAQRIRDAILEGTVQPGARLIEADIAAELGVSRGPVREGIRLLAGEGLVVLRRNRGAIVSSPTFEDILEVYVLRKGLGSLALQHAISLDVATAPEFDDALVLLDRLRDPQVQAEPMLMMHADLAFQSQLFDLSGLERITGVLDQTARDIPVFVRVLGITYDAVDHAALIERHEQLVDAIRGHRRGDALKAWDDHIRSTVGEFSRGYPDAQMEGIFDLPLMHHIFHRPSSP